MGVFKAYDIRGVYPEEINEDLAKKIGNAIAVYFNCKDIVVGMDMRLSSPKLFSALAEGICDSGANVHLIGMCTTPLLSFAVIRKKFDFGIMISASHNPSKYNAFKLIKYPGFQIHKDLGMKEIQDIVEKGEYAEIEGKRGEIIENKNIIDEYIIHIKQYALSIKNKKIVIDYGNGVGAITAKKVFDDLELEVVHMYSEPDGNFPNHEANPLEEKNLIDLKKKVIEERANLGISFDGDADRCIIVDDKGETIPADLIVAYLSQYEISDHINKNVYFDLRFSRVVAEEIKKNGGNPVKMKVGNPFYKEVLINEGGAFASELSGHMMFPENYSIDDGLFAAIKILDALSHETEKISEVIKEYKKYYATEEINMTIKDGNLVFKNLKNKYKNGKISELDGVSIDYEDWWFNIRKSNTEPLIRLRIEANTLEKRDQKRAEIIDLISKL
jgi:phosphomannomutase